jgi:hypothetical protein
MSERRLNLGTITREGRPGCRRRERWEGRQEGREEFGSYLLLSLLMYAGLYVDCV